MAATTPEMPNMDQSELGLKIVGRRLDFVNILPAPITTSSYSRASILGRMSREGSVSSTLNLRACTSGFDCQYLEATISISM